MRSRGWYTKAYATPQNARLGGGSRGSRGASNPKVGRLPRNLHEELSPRLDKDRNRSDHARNKHDEAEYSEPGLRVIDVDRPFFGLRMRLGFFARIISRQGILYAGTLENCTVLLAARVTCITVGSLGSTHVGSTHVDNITVVTRRRGLGPMGNAVPYMHKEEVRAAADTGIEQTQLRGQRRVDGWGV